MDLHNTVSQGGVNHNMFVFKQSIMPISRENITCLEEITNDMKLNFQLYVGPLRCLIRDHCNAWQWSCQYQTWSQEDRGQTMTRVKTVGINASLVSLGSDRFHHLIFPVIPQCWMPRFGQSI